jgi:hypothetical protein
MGVDFQMNITETAYQLAMGRIPFSVHNYNEDKMVVTINGDINNEQLKIVMSLGATYSGGAFNILVTL